MVMHIYLLYRKRNLGISFGQQMILSCYKFICKFSLRVPACPPNCTLLLKQAKLVEVSLRSELYNGAWTRAFPPFILSNNNNIVQQHPIVCSWERVCTSAIQQSTGCFLASPMPMPAGQLQRRMVSWPAGAG